ncbi:MAG: GNAT family N-acetyltransferase [Pseudomonadota bacterium]
MDRSFLPIASMSHDTQETLRALNNANSEATSFLDTAGWEALIGMASLALAPANADALLIAFGPGAAYPSPNYRWHTERYERFLYVDRIVVSASARGRGYARALYAALADVARDQALERIVCEVNRVPANPGSDAFHDRLGFVEVGRAHPYGDAKLVRYLALELDGPEGSVAPR